jgi:ABC-type branched-subunit amino acid transport system substrate-binding protein
MKNHYSFVIYFIFLNAISFFSAHSEPHQKCGVIVTQTGPMAVIGIGIKNGIILASGDNNGGGYTQFLFEDDQFQPKNAVTAFHKLLDIDRINCLIAFGSTTSLAVADLAERAKIPMISIAITPKTVEGRSYVFRAYIPMEKQNAAIVSEVIRRKYESVAIISSIQDATLAVREAFLDTSKISIVFDEKVNPEDIELRSIAAKIKALNPPAVFLNLLPPQISVLAKLLRNFGYTGEFFSGPTLGNSAEIKASSGTLAGAWFASLSAPTIEEYRTRYINKFQETPPIESLYGYDVGKLIIEAAKNGDLFGFLTSLKTFHGIIGNYGMVNHTLDFPVGIWKVNKESFEYCKEFC